MRKIRPFLFVLTLILISLPVLGEKVIILNLNNLGDSITYGSTELGDLPLPQREQMPGQYRAELITINNESKYTTTFNQSFIGTTAVVFPYSASADHIVVKNQAGATLFTIPIQFVSSFCGNGICDAEEDEKGCSADCKAVVLKNSTTSKASTKRNSTTSLPPPEPSKQKTEKDASRDTPDKSAEEDIKTVEDSDSSISPLTIIFIILGALVVVLFAFIVVMNKRDKSSTPNSAAQGQMRVPVGLVRQWLSQGKSPSDIKSILISQGYSPTDIDAVLRSVLISQTTDPNLSRRMP